jgi:hypothetical protein
VRPIAAHIAAFAFFSLLTLLVTWPLADIVTTGVLGAVAGDNLSALWNIWWARTALEGGGGLFWTPVLFAPLGTSLTLHSFAPLASVTAAAFPADPLTLYNLSLAAAVFLNFACAYWAAWSTTHDPIASTFAAVAFGAAPCLLVRLQGHLNVLSAWGLPLAIVAIRHHVRRPGAIGAMLLALVLAALVYTDPYYAIFGAAMSASYLALSARPVRVRARPLTPWRTRLLATLAILAVVAAAIGTWIEVTGGTDTIVAGVRLRMTDSFNLRVAIGFLLLGAWLAWKWPALSREAPIDFHPGAWRWMPVTAGVLVLLALPLVAAVVQLWRAGDYESQVYFWRSAPPGIDVAALALGNPLGALSGRWTAALFDRLAIDRVESAVWIGLAPLLLFAWTVRHRGSRPGVRRYLWMAGLFFVWALGPYLRVFGSNTAFMLPQTLLRFVPLVANARIPGRAFVVVQLMIALIAAEGIVLMRGSSRGRLLAFAALVVLMADVWPAPHPWTPIDRPAIYQRLASQPPGIVLEIPLGVGDGFGVRGDLDHRTLFYQTMHRHPQMGGFVARLSSRIKTAYDNDPIIGPVLKLSEHSLTSVAPPLAPPAPRAPCALTCDVRYVVINEATVSSELRSFIAKAFHLRLLEQTGARALYAVE